jgi:plasmid stabilization system protein ParE
VRVRFARVAALEAREARRYYDGEREGLGGRFVGELRATLRRITEHPLAWPECEPSIRRALVNRFPYLVHYTLQEDEVFVLGVYHARRRPISWTDRLGRDV